jgi:hypothetical protein
MEQVLDHALEYRAGVVEIWDNGTYESLESTVKAIAVLFYGRAEDAVNSLHS